MTLDRKWSFIETAASTGERIALYSILLADLLGRSTELQVTEDDCILNTEFVVLHSISFVVTVHSYYRFRDRSKKGTGNRRVVSTRVCGHVRESASESRAK